MARLTPDIRDPQRQAIRLFLARAGYSQEAAASLMGVDYGIFRKIAAGVLELSPYYICRMLEALMTPPPQTADADARAADVKMRYDAAMMLIVSAGSVEYAKRRQSAQSRVTWRDRPPPLAPARVVDK